MRHYYGKKATCVALAALLATTMYQPMVAEELDTEIPSAGAAVVIDQYVNNTDAKDVSAFLPKDQVQTSATNTTTTTASSSGDSYFTDKVIAKVAGGKDDYVNVRKKPDANSKVEGKIYNNCGAKVISKTSNGWLKITSGNCTGYTKAEYFVSGSTAKEHALDDGYVFANIQGTGIHVREKAATTSDVVTNVYRNENYVIKKFSDDGQWVKIKIGDGVSGWISASYVKVSVDMDTAITIKEEKAIIKRQQEEAAAEAARQAQEEADKKAAAQAEVNNNNDRGYDNSSSSSSNSSSSNSSSNNSSSSNSSSSSSSSNSSSSSSRKSSSSSSSSSYSSGSKGAQVVAYAKRFLGNPYVYGGSSLTNGTDCSGFTMSVYAHFGYSLNRTSYTQVYDGSSVSMGSLRAGDLLFYKYGGSTISHVAMYIGGGRIIHASSPTTGIIISGMGSPCAARRIIG